MGRAVTGQPTPLRVASRSGPKQSNHQMQMRPGRPVWPWSRSSELRGGTLLAVDHGAVRALPPWFPVAG